MAGYQCSCGYQTGDSSNFNRHLGACEVETHGGPREHSGRKPKVDDEDPFDVGTRGGPREHSGRKPRVDNLNRHLGACEVELELELIHTQMTQKPMLRGEVGARAWRNQTGGGGGGGGERVQRSVGALAQECVSGPQNRKRSQDVVSDTRQQTRSFSVLA